MPVGGGNLNCREAHAGNSGHKILIFTLLFENHLVPSEPSQRKTIKPFVGSLAVKLLRKEGNQELFGILCALFVHFGSFW